MNDENLTGSTGVNDSSGGSVGPTSSLLAAVWRRQSTVATKARRKSGLGNYIRSLGKKLTKKEVDVELAARRRAEELGKKFGTVGRQQARAGNFAEEFKAVSKELDEPRKARRKIARVRAKRVKA
jgi:hypothetical protein